MDGIKAKQNSLFENYLRLFPYIKPLLIPFFVSIIGFAIFAASQPMLAKLMEMVIDAINNKDTDARWLLPLYAVGIFFIRGVGSFLGTYYNAFVAGRLITNIRIDMFNHLITLPAVYYQSKTDGQIFQRITGSVNLISQTFTNSIKILIREGLTVIFLLAYVFYLNWRLSLTFLAVTPFLLLVVSYTSKRFRSITRKNENISASLIQAVSEVISGYEIMRIFGGEAYEKARHQTVADKSFNNAMKMRRIESLSTPIIQLLVASVLAMIIFLLLQPETLAHSNSAELIGYLTAVGLIPKSLKQLSGLNVQIQRGLTGADLIFELLDTQSEIDTGTYQCDRVRGQIKVDNVCFRYSPNQEPVLNNISFEITSGKMVALVGKSGSGKSTLAALLQRFYDVESGNVLIDGIDIREYQLSSLRKQIALVSQNIVLFNDSIRNNIAYGGMRDASDEEILNAAQRAHALEFIEKLPQGINTQIGDRGLQLSGGQRQRIAIARAFLKNAPILILDEATSALDNQSEQSIQAALDEVMLGRTTIVIAHRLSTIERADTIFVMDTGKIIEQGTHDELIQKNDYYVKLYHAGFDTA